IFSRDWSSDVCSSDLTVDLAFGFAALLPVDLAVAVQVQFHKPVLAHPAFELDVIIMVVIELDALEMADPVVAANLQHAFGIVKTALGEGCGGGDKAADQCDGQSLFHGV